MRPNIALYYSGWYERFKSAFAIQVTDNGAVPFIQIDPTGINMSAIASGAFDTFLKSFATDVASYGASTHQGVIIGFGHEMNGYWYPWGSRTRAPGPVRGGLAAHRHRVPAAGRRRRDLAVDGQHHRPGPRHPVPGGVVARRLLRDLGGDRRLLPQALVDVRLPVRADHQGRARADPPPDPDLRDRRRARAGQPGKIADLFTGTRAYGLLGFVWFDAKGSQDWRLRDPAALAAYRQGAKTYREPAP